MPGGAVERLAQRAGGVDQVGSVDGGGVEGRIAHFGDRIGHYHHLHQLVDGGGIGGGVGVRLTLSVCT